MATRVLVASSTYEGTDADYVCDGEDDQVQINKAIQFVGQAYGGGTVELSSGTFDVNQSTISVTVPALHAAIYIDQSAIVLMGQGYSTIINPSDSVTAVVAADGKSGELDLDRVELRDFRVISFTDRAVHAAAVDDATISGIVTEAGNYGISVADCINPLIKDNVISSPVQRGIEVGGGITPGGLVTNNTITSATDVGISIASDGSNVVIQDNVITGAGGEAIKNEGDAVTITGNTIRDCDEGIELTANSANSFVAGNHVETSTTADYVDAGADTTLLTASAATGNVGIGTVPATSMRFKAETDRNLNAAGLFKNTHATGSFGLIIEAGDDSGNYALDVRDKDATSLLRVLGNGHVGIGKDAPAGPLHVKADASHVGIRLEENSGTEYMSLLVNADGSLVIEDDDGDDIVTITDGAPANSVFVDASGQVGLGMSPTVPFQIKSDGNGDVMQIIESASTDILISFVQSDDDEGRIYVRHDNAVTIDLRGNGASFFNGGNVGIGKAPADLLDVEGGRFHLRGTGTLQAVLRVDSNLTTSAHDIVQFRSDIGSTDNVKWRVEADGDTISDTGAYTSDERIKRNIVTITGALTIVAALRPIRFDFVEGWTKPGPYFGFSSQDVERIVEIESLVRDDGIGAPDFLRDQGVDTVKALRYNDFIAINTAAIRELLARVVALEAASA